MADVHVGGLTWKTARFTRSDIQSGVIKTVADDIAKASVASLLGNLKLDVTVLGLGLNVTALTNAHRDAHDPGRTVGRPVERTDDPARRAARRGRRA